MPRARARPSPRRGWTPSRTRRRPSPPCCTSSAWRCGRAARRPPRRCIRGCSASRRRVRRSGASRAPDWTTHAGPPPSVPCSHGRDLHRDHLVLASLRRHGRGLALRARDRARRGRVRVRPRGQALPRRHRGPLVRQPRARPRGRRRRGPRADGRLAAYSTFGDFSNPPANALAARLAAHAPMEDAKVFLASGGGDAIDTAAKIARRHWVLQGPARAHAPPQPHERLPRHARLRHLDRRHRGEHGQLGPARPAHLGRRLRLAPGARAGDPARRARARAPRSSASR